MKSQSQRDLEKHWADQSKKQTPAERLRIKAEKLRKQIERDKALLERNRKKAEESGLQPAGQTMAPRNPETEGKRTNSKSAGPAQRRTRE